MNQFKSQVRHTKYPHHFNPDYGYIYSTIHEVQNVINSTNCKHGFNTSGTCLLNGQTTGTTGHSEGSCHNEQKSNLVSFAISPLM